MRIFIAYASEDEGLASDLAAALQQSDHKVFFAPGSLSPGDGFHDRIRDEIEQADLFVFLISPESTTEGSYALSEVKFAAAHWPDPEGRFLPVMIRETPAERIPAYIRNSHIMRPKGDPVPEVLAEIARRKEPSNSTNSPPTVPRRGALLLSSFVVVAIAAAALVGFALGKWPLTQRENLSSRPPADRSDFEADRLFRSNLLDLIKTSFNHAREAKTRHDKQVADQWSQIVEQLSKALLVCNGVASELSVPALVRDEYWIGTHVGLYRVEADGSLKPFLTGESIGMIRAGETHGVFVTTAKKKLFFVNGDLAQEVTGPDPIKPNSK